MLSNSLIQHINIQDYILRMWQITNRIGFKEKYISYNDRNGYVDLLLIYKDKKIGVEIDKRLPKLKSIEKVNKYDISILIERSKQTNYHKLGQRIKNIHNKYMVILLHEQYIYSNMNQDDELYRFFKGIMSLCKDM